MPPLSDYILVLSTGFMCSGHCIGMCGGFVLMYSVAAGAGGGGSWYAHATYNLGRVVTYCIVGGIMGYIGSFVEAAGRIKGVQGAALLVAGALMIAMGLNLLGLLGKAGLIESFGITGTIGFRAAFKRLVNMKGPLSMLPLGLLLGLVPCGLSYTMEIRAASSGGFWQGFTLMAAFGLGTVPAMAGFGFFSSAMTARFRERLYKAAAVMVILLGVQSILRGLAFNGVIERGWGW